MNNPVAINIRQGICFSKRKHHVPNRPFNKLNVQLVVPLLKCWYSPLPKCHILTNTDIWLARTQNKRLSANFVVSVAVHANWAVFPYSWHHCEYWNKLNHRWFDVCWQLLPTSNSTVILIDTLFHTTKVKKETKTTSLPNFQGICSVKKICLCNEMSFWTFVKVKLPEHGDQLSYFA